MVLSGMLHGVRERGGQGSSTHGTLTQKGAASLVAETMSASSPSCER